MPISRAQQEAVTRYNNKAYDSICLRLPAGRKQLVENLADANSMSVNMVVNAVLAQACGLSYETWTDPHYQPETVSDHKVNFTIKLEQGRGEFIKQAAAQRGKTANDLVNEALAHFLGFDLDVWTGKQQRNHAAGQDGQGVTK